MQTPCALRDVRSTNAVSERRQTKNRDHILRHILLTIPDSKCYYNAKQGNEKLHVREEGKEVEPRERTSS